MKIPEEGQQAPDFRGENQHGEQISLNQFKGKKAILYFYPKDNTPGCTAEACNFRDHYQELIDKGFEIIGVSPDSMESHQKFMKKNNLPFHLIADTEKEIIKKYGAWGKKKMFGKTYEGVHRTTFVISEDQTIEKVFKKVKTKDHTNQILESID